MIRGDLTYHEAEAILQQLAGAASWDRAELAPLTEALAAAKEKYAPSQDTAPRPRRDITRRSWSEKTFRALVESAPDALVIFDQDKTVA